MGMGWRGWIGVLVGPYFEREMGGNGMVLEWRGRSGVRRGFRCR